MIATYSGEHAVFATKAEADRKMAEEEADELPGYRLHRVRATTL